MGEPEDPQASVASLTESATVLGFLNPYALHKLTQHGIVSLCKAIDAYEKATGKTVTFVDDQDFFSGKFQTGVGDAMFNTTAKHPATFTAIFDQLNANKSLARAFFEGLKTQDGNVPQMLGSAAKVIYENRRLPSRMEHFPYDAGSQKDYYFFAGMFVGAQSSAAIRDLGRLGSKLNIALNPLSRLMNVVTGDIKWRDYPGYLKLNNFHKIQMLEAGYAAGEIVRKRKQRATSPLMHWIMEGSSQIPFPNSDAILQAVVDYATPAGTATEADL